jgi:SAM-dependent methyltransferase
LFRYVGDISNISHDIVLRYLNKFDAAVDATLGNGYDTDFLSRNFKRVFAFDIQGSAVESYKLKNKDNVTLINKSHEELKNYVGTSIDCVMYNLGFLPGGDKSITTEAHSTLLSLKDALNILNPGGLISIAVYIGHEEGRKEKDAIFSFIQNLPKREYGVLVHSFANRNNSPLLIIIEKNQ